MAADRVAAAQFVLGRQLVARPQRPRGNLASHRLIQAAIARHPNGLLHILFHCAMPGHAGLFVRVYGAGTKPYHPATGRHVGLPPKTCPDIFHSPAPSRKPCKEAPAMETTAPIQNYANFVDGELRDGRDGQRFESTNPATGLLFGRFVESSADDVNAAVRAAAAAFEGPWSKLSPTRRGRLLMRWGDLIAENADHIATLETEQNGKLYAEMRTQARLVQDWLYYFGGLADKVEGRVIPLDRTSVLNYTTSEPLGVVGVIVPWNSPTFLTIMTVAPALAAGNTVVIKPSEVTSASAIELAKLAEQAGLPRGVVNVVTGGRLAGEALVDHPGVAKISFTGSDMAGRAIAAKEG